MDKRPKQKFPNPKTCKTCRIGSCCYEGAEMTKSELLRILRFNPKIKKPWFRLVEISEGLDSKHPFSTLMRKGTCIFHDRKNRCLIYPVRPKNCREFPLEKGKPAMYYKRLCRVFAETWPQNRVKKTFLRRRKIN